MLLACMMRIITCFCAVGTLSVGLFYGVHQGILRIFCQLENRKDKWMTTDCGGLLKENNKSINSVFIFYHVKLKQA